MSTLRASLKNLCLISLFNRTFNHCQINWVVIADIMQHMALFRWINYLYIYIYIYVQHMTLFRLPLWLVYLKQGSTQDCIHTVVFCYHMIHY